MSDLVKRLRTKNISHVDADIWMMDAADRIEKLEAKLAAADGAGRGVTVKPLPRSNGDGGWTLPMELLQELEREVMADGWEGCTAEVTEIIALSVERRILSAITTNAEALLAFEERG